MEADAPGMSVRVVQLFTLQLLVTPVLYVIIRLRLPVLFAMMLLTSLVALTCSTEWAPPNMASAVFAAVLLPFIASLLGLLLGYVLIHIFDDFRLDDEEQKANNYQFASAMRLGLAVIAILLVGAHVLVIAVPRDALMACLIVHLVAALILFGGAALVTRRLQQQKRAWVLYGAVYVVSFAIISFTMILSNSLFWTFFIVAVVYCIAIISVFIAAMIFSNDFKAAVAGLANGMPSDPAPPPLSSGPPPPAQMPYTTNLNGNRGNGGLPSSFPSAPGGGYAPVPTHGNAAPGSSGSNAALELLSGFFGKTNS